MSKQLVGTEIGQSELKRRTRLLNSLIWLLMGTLGIFLVCVLALGLQSLTSGLISLVSALLVCSIGYWLARSGKFYAAVYLFLSSFVILLLVLVFLGAGTSFTVSGEPGLGGGIVVIAIAVSFILACMSWLFGESINNAFSALRQRSEELQASHKELESANEELQAANEELTETQEQLIRSEKLAAIGQLAGGVGHELRNPLGAIKNAVYYIKGKVANSELAQQELRVMEFLDIMDDEINSSNKIINDLLGFSRVGKPAVSLARIEKVINDALALTHTPIPENIELTKKVDAGLPEAEIDTDQIHQVLVNVIMNAVQAMPEGGKLTIGAKQEDKFLEVEISDTGYGIPQETIDKIFDPLFTTKAKGIGLGLAVCKAIIDRHDGHTAVKSKVGKGTTFTIKLPLRVRKDT